MDDTLVSLAEQVKAKAYDDARAGLRDYVRQQPDQPYAWYLLSFADSSHAKRLAAARQAAKLAPDSAPVQTRLAQLQARRGRFPARRLLAVAAALVILGGALLVVLKPGARPASPPMPTLAALPTLQPTAASLALALPTDAPSTAPPTAETLPSQAASPLPVETVALPVVQHTATHTLPPPIVPTFEPLLPTLELPTSAPAQPPVETIAPVTAPPTVTRPPTATPGVTNPPPTSIANAAPLNMPLNIGSGDLRVIAATRPGDGLIRDLGGSVAPAPPGKVWLLVELLLVCGSANNCAPDASALRVLGTAGMTYTPEASLQVNPLFGAGAYMAGQVWGYAGFLVPTGEAALYLTLARGGQDYIFALQ